MECDGQVKWFNSDKGYGFITREDGPDVFVHFRQIKSEEDYKTLKQGQDVHFNVVEGRKGPEAENVVLKH